MGEAIDLGAGLGEGSFCGLTLQIARHEPTAIRDAYDALCAYTLTLGDPAFIHQHVIDAFAAQNATDTSRPIHVAFALVGLYLHVERGFTGRQVQQVHQQLARHRGNWPSFTLPRTRGQLTAIDVMKAPEGPKRDRAIHEWCTAVWDAFAGNLTVVISLLNDRGFRPATG